MESESVINFINIQNSWHNNGGKNFTVQTSKSKKAKGLLEGVIGEVVEEIIKCEATFVSLKYYNLEFLDTYASIQQDQRYAMEN
jgi:hypothetical protein